MNNMITTKTFIRALLIFALAIWATTYVYLVSSKSSLLLYDEKNNLYAKEENLLKQFNELARLNPHSLLLIHICEYLCQIKVCEKDFSSGKQYLAQLFIVADSALSGVDEINLHLFAGNIYRDFGQLEQAQTFYQKALAGAEELGLDNKATVHSVIQDTGMNKAKILNNLGVLYFLLGKRGENKEESWKNYLLAKD